ncbi:hypothetical protein GXP67_09810 [Rhodocytophaga rosea]|uniref:DUF4386 family protein n=1 Tax=Rhodocytophaga rosea TaxID=2704465 RepID=A0A6C0GUR3_9BACT|nr:hypothetical protein GXP67_09810 [Rhodocytophaga rosea]
MQSTQPFIEPLSPLGLFPGRWVGGISLILGPVLILTGALLRIEFHFFAPQQLSAYEAHPTLITAAYSCFAVGNVVLCFGIIILATLISAWNRVWGIWGGALAISGLFTRTFHAGIDHLAFQLVDVQGMEMAWKAVSDSYRAFHIFRYFNGHIMAGWIVLSIGAYRSGTLNLYRSLALALMVMVPFGTLKGTEIRAIGILGLCVALIPLGISLLRNGPPLSRKAVFWIVAINLLGIVFVILSILFPALMN